MSEAYIGEIRLFAGNYAPQGWALCDGSLISISENEALFSLLGTTYGGNGQTTFALPDLRGRLPIGVGQGPGLTMRALGQSPGTEQVTLSTSHMPHHTHAFAVGASANSNLPQGQVPASVTDLNLYSESALSMQPLAAGSIQSSGGGQPHDNIMPSMALSFIICLYGIYPSFQ